MSSTILPQRMNTSVNFSALLLLYSSLLLLIAVGITNAGPLATVEIEELGEDSPLYERPVRRGRELFGKRSAPSPPAKYVIIDGFPTTFPPAARLFFERLRAASQERQRLSGGNLHQLVKGTPGASILNDGEEEGEEEDGAAAKVLKRRSRELFGKRSVPLAANADGGLDEMSTLEGADLRAMIEAMDLERRSRRGRTRELFG